MSQPGIFFFFFFCGPGSSRGLILIGNLSAPNPCCSSPLPWGFFARAMRVGSCLSPPAPLVLDVLLCSCHTFTARSPFLPFLWWAAEELCPRASPSGTARSPNSPEPLHSLHAPRGRSAARSAFGGRVYFDCGAAISQARDICNILEGRKQQFWPQSMFLTSES